MAPRRTSDGPIVHLLDVGRQNYGDAILCAFGDTTVLIDGAHSGNSEDDGRAHPSIPNQLQDLLGGEAPTTVSLLIVSHVHDDHIGCLPKLVKDNLLHAKWALVADPAVRWGDGADVASDAPQEVLAQALLEEIRLAPKPDELDQLLSDAARLRPSYEGMLKTLEDRGTKVVRFDGTANRTKAILKAFSSVGFHILGPSADQVSRCSNLIQARSDALRGFASDLLPRGDVGQPDDLPSTYRSIVRQLQASPDALDSFRKDQGAINDTSLVVSFEYGGAKLLFTGDIQLEDPQVSDERIHDEMKDLRQRIRDAGPWDFLKLSHHGSDNGFSDDFWSEIRKPEYMGLCTGSDSSNHPNPKTLKVLKSHTNDVAWARTDHNGQTTFTRKGEKWNIEVTKGNLNDPRPNAADTAEPEGAARESEEQIVRAAPEARPPQVAAGTAPDGRLEVRAFLPSRIGRVTIMIDVSAPGGTHEIEINDPGAVRRAPGPQERPDPVSVTLAQGRKIPSLLFVTQRDTLARNIGVAEAKAVLRAIQDGGHALLDVPSHSSAEAVGQVRDHLNKTDSAQGVVILGGYDVVRPQILDTLPKSVRARLRSNADPDNFIVWSDDGYGDLDGDGMPEFPVSRIPDGHASALTLKALQASAPARENDRSGIRNKERPFANEIYDMLPGNGQMLVSGPVLFDDTPAYSLDAAHVYLMLHGNDRDATRFWGEEPGEYPIAMTLANVPSSSGMVAFTGCCWGALAGQPRANRLEKGANPRARGPETSIALQFLARGAIAFVGCTGVHYSPGEDEDGGGAPMHRAFWRALASGKPPAASLFTAKHDYFQWLTDKRSRDPLVQAIQFKILKEYTCLGLGW